MKLREDIDLVDFLKKVKNCEGEVFLYTPEGDCLNLNSVLSQYVFVVLAEQKELLAESRLELNKEDEQKLKKYLVQEDAAQ